jgi:hypothetical protein
MRDQEGFLERAIGCANQKTPALDKRPPPWNVRRQQAI